MGYELIADCWVEMMLLLQGLKSWQGIMGLRLLLIRLIVSSLSMGYSMICC